MEIAKQIMQDELGKERWMNEELSESRPCQVYHVAATLMMIQRETLQTIC
jgi:hypothetical protein